jgi:zinc transport system substrate-binding protein
MAAVFPLLCNAASVEKEVFSVQKDSVSELLVITSIKPLALIAQAALGETAKVEFLQSATQSAHDLTLTVSALNKIHQAALVVLVGDEFEPRVAKLVQDIPGKAFLNVLDLPFFSSDVDIHGDMQQKSADPHLWVNPYSANIIGHAIQAEFGIAKRDIISEDQIKALKKSLKPVATLDYISHHDVLGNFAKAFNVSAGIPIRDGNGGHKGVKSQLLLRNVAHKSGAQCVFIEPQYADKDATVIANELNLPLRTIDPQGIDVPLTEKGYAQFMQTLVVQFKACFS